MELEEEWSSRKSVFFTFCFSWCRFIMYPRFSSPLLFTLPPWPELPPLWPGNCGSLLTSLWFHLWPPAPHPLHGASVLLLLSCSVAAISGGRACVHPMAHKASLLSAPTTLPLRCSYHRALGLNAPPPDLPPVPIRPLLIPTLCSTQSFSSL